MQLNGYLGGKSFPWSDILQKYAYIADDRREYYFNLCPNATRPIQCPGIVHVYRKDGITCITGREPISEMRKK
jgi:hypothetical protein